MARTQFAQGKRMDNGVVLVSVIVLAIIWVGVNLSCAGETLNVVLFLLSLHKGKAMVDIGHVDTAMAKTKRINTCYYLATDHVTRGCNHCDGMILVGERHYFDRVTHKHYHQNHKPSADQ